MFGHLKLYGRWDSTPAVDGAAAQPCCMGSSVYVDKVIEGLKERLPSSVKDDHAYKEEGLVCAKNVRLFF